MYNFSVLPDGNEPAAGLIDVDGTLYGTTAWGGGYGHGAAFSITSSGTEKVLHSFGKGTDGYYPQAGLIDVGGTLYGTTEYGGSGSCSNDFYHGCGTVFSITTGGKEKVLHSFSDAGAQGSNPLAGLIDVGGTLYGATKNGGSNNAGAIFSITTLGREKLLHSFGRGTDGRYPDATLIDVGGRLYGTTFNGGGHGEGTVFSITTGGAEKVLH
ncbi:MAG: choice-of-anchor tandem repeat GloVer-containing protein, partial [Candidatus Cybelea sp.]